LATSNTQFDVITVDLFSGESAPSFVFDKTFYKNLSKATDKTGVVALNLAIENEQTLLNLLLHSKQYFKHRAIADFVNFQNIVLYLSNQELTSPLAGKNNDAIHDNLDLKHFIIID